MHFSVFAVAFAVAAIAAGPSSTPIKAICPPVDSCGAPLCTGGADYAQSSSFKCYFSELSGSELCSFPLTTHTDLYCSYKTGGSLIADHDDDCCVPNAPIGVDAWRARDMDRRADKNEVEKRAQKKMKTQ
ncbi:hypothetical protein RQP46_005920 [Phenoliferia psychrophenolica]